jgi:hypothetical protein
MVDLTDGQIIIILTVITVFLTLFLIIQAWRYQKKKKLLFLLDQSLSLVKIKESYRDRIKVSYNDIIVDDLSLAQVIIRNSGNSSILKENIKAPIKFKFDIGTKVIDAKVIDMKPDGIIFNINKQSDNEFYGDFELLNQGYEVKLQFVCIGGGSKSPEIDASMIADTQIKISSYKEYLEEKDAYKGILFFISTSFLGIGSIWLTTLTKNPYSIVFLGLIGIVFLILSTGYIIYYIWQRIIKSIFLFIFKRKSLH